MNNIPIDKQFKMVCNFCRSENVLLDAWASWDFKKQKWAVSDTFSTGHCVDCGGSTDIKKLSMMDLLLGIDSDFKEKNNV